MSGRYLLDEHLHLAAARGLRAKDVDAVGVAEREDLRGRVDEEILEAATAEDRAVVTRNIGDFVDLDRRWALAGRAHAGILCVALRSFPEDAAALGRLVAAIAAQDAGAGQPRGYLDFLAPVGG